MEHAYGEGANEEARRFVSGDFPHRALYEGEDVATMTSKEYLDWCSWITRDFVATGGDFPKEPFEL